MTETHAQVTQNRRISPVWVVPILAVVLGAWMVFYTWQNEGPTIEIHFDTAAGIEAGKTKIRARSVEIGLVEHVELSEDFEHVIVTAKMERFAMPLLREDSQLWMVTARIGSGGVTGLGTLLSGGYLELSPGEGAEGQRESIGLETPPVTPAGTPGVHFTLHTQEAGSVNTGNPILYRGYTIGRIETKTFDIDAQLMRYTAFVEAPYDDLVTENTHFWNSSGVALEASANGFEVEFGSVETLLLGGVSLGLPDGMEPGPKAGNGSDFRIYPEQENINEQFYRYSTEYVILFDRSVRGLRPGAPVEFRGLHSGEVVRVMIKEMIESRDHPSQQDGTIAVLIRMQPGPLMMGDSLEGAARLEEGLKNGVENGLRATLMTGSLLTGSLFVSLDYNENAEPPRYESFAGRKVIPSSVGGLQSIEIKITALLDKLNELPVEKVVDSANTALGSADAALVDLQKSITELNAILANEDLQALPQSVQETLQELDRTLKQFGGLAGTLEAQPNSIIFPQPHEADPEPSAGVP